MHRSLYFFQWGFLLLALTTPVRLYAQTIYVDADATGSEDGSSWENAFAHLQDALNAPSGAVIWVAEGTYHPDRGATVTPGDRAATFQLRSHLAIYGGFAGTEASLDERDVHAHPTTLSGDIGTPDDASDNSYHVVTGSGTDSTAVLDGFIITAGQADGASPDDRGGGLININGSPTVANVTFLDNTATALGGGMYNEGERNNTTRPTVTNVLFLGNAARGGFGGGGMANDRSDPLVLNAVFSGNTAAAIGGGMYNLRSNPTIVNTTFSGNTATSGGGMSNSSVSFPTLTNVIFWGNTATNQEGQIFNDSSSQPPMDYSLVQDELPNGVFDEGQNRFSDPLFVDADGSDDVAGTLDDDVRLRVDSPAIDAGNNDALPPDTRDLDGDGTTTDPFPVDLDLHRRTFTDGSGTATVDLGPYEFGAPSLHTGIGASEHPVSPVRSTAYPNPFHTETTLEFSLDRPLPVQAVLYDTLGRRIRTLYETPASSRQEHTFRVDGRQLPSGLYVVHFTGEGVDAAQHIILLR